MSRFSRCPLRFCSHRNTIQVEEVLVMGCSKYEELENSTIFCLFKRTVLVPPLLTFHSKHCSSKTKTLFGSVVLQVNRNSPCGVGVNVDFIFLSPVLQQKSPFLLLFYSKLTEKFLRPKKQSLLATSRFLPKQQNFPTPTAQFSLSLLHFFLLLFFSHQPSIYLFTIGWLFSQIAFKTF